MKRVCAWCGKDMGEEKPIENTEITHGICRECMAELESERCLKLKT